MVPGLPGEPECAEWFAWDGWYYLVFSNGAVARYWMARAPHVFQDPRTGEFHMLVTTSLEGQTGAGRGCLAHLVSADLRAWRQAAPFIVPGLPGEPV